MRMHRDEVPTSPELVRRLLTDQFPRWADLAIERVPSAGTENAMYRLGGELSVRMPRMPRAEPAVRKEYDWLPVLAPQLPLPVPVPLALGDPSDTFPFVWTVCRWLAGRNPDARDLQQRNGVVTELAVDLADFLNALHAIDRTDGPTAERGLPVGSREQPFNTAMDALAVIAASGEDPAIGALDLDAINAAWIADSAAPPWSGPPVWIHADISSLNILCDPDGRLDGVLDFGTAGTGDPACDMIAAWNLLPAQVRQDFRGAVDVDDATWARGRAWALSIAVIQLPYYYRTNPELCRISYQVIDAVLTECSVDRMQC